MSTTQAEQAEALKTDPFPYGWRYIKRDLASGSFTYDQVPLTLEDVLHPQEGDQIMHNDMHQRICTYLYNVIRGLLAAFPSAVVLQDVRVAWDVPELRPHGPDIAVIFGVAERKNWSTFDVSKEGVRPTLIIEVTSPETRRLDLTEKQEEYDLAGVEYYIIVDLVRRRGQVFPLLLGYRQTIDTYTLLSPDATGRIWIEPLKIWLGLDGQHVIAYDEAGVAIEDYVELAASRSTQAAARAAAELRIAELEVELRRLRGEQ